MTQELLDLMVFFLNVDHLRVTQHDLKGILIFVGYKN